MIDGRGIQRENAIGEAPEEVERQALEMLFAGRDLDEIASSLKLTDYAMAFNRAAREALRILCHQGRLPEGPGISIDRNGNFPRREGAQQKGRRVSVEDDDNALVMWLKDRRRTEDIADHFGFQSPEAGRQMVLRGALRKVEHLRALREGVRNGTLKLNMADADHSLIVEGVDERPEDDKAWDRVVLASNALVTAEPALATIEAEKSACAGVVLRSDVIAKLEELAAGYEQAAAALDRAEQGNPVAAGLAANGAGIRSAIAPIMEIPNARGGIN